MPDDSDNDHASALSAPQPVVGYKANEVYDDAFFSQYGKSNPEYRQACLVIAKTLLDLLKPRKVVDFGCGAGLHLEPFMESKVEVLGIDVAPACISHQPGNLPFLLADLRLPFSLTSPFTEFDLALCVDVLEHIEEEHAQVALNTITRGAKTCILSCAPPGQGGHFHVNEQPRRYWVDRMKGMGWQYDRKSTGQLERYFLGHRKQLPWSWMYHNLCIYKRADTDKV
ncbi:MAG: class I SAM-dependent methyltransferase [Myxococcales bacterium]|nr:MAG: class I SAM-dependent methyltransferase [Myxococcales bacterium]